MSDLKKLLLFLKNWWTSIKEHEYSVNVKNQIKIPEYPKFPEIPEINLDEIKTILQEIVGTIDESTYSMSEKLSGLKQENLDLSPLIAKIDSLKDNSEITKEIRSIVDSINGISLSVDFSGLENGINMILNKLSEEKVEEEDLTQKQILEVLRNINLPTFPKTIAITSDDLIAINNNINNLVGLEIPPYDEQVIDLADPDDISITYKKDSVTVATKSIVTSGTTITITKI